VEETGEIGHRNEVGEKLSKRHLKLNLVEEVQAELEEACGVVLTRSMVFVMLSKRARGV